MADNTDDAMKDPDNLQHLSEVHLQNPMAREEPKLFFFFVFFLRSPAISLGFTTFG